MKRKIIDTSFGEVMVSETTELGYLDCYIGDNYDDYLFTIEGRLGDDDLPDKIDDMLG
jgi:hypothetical protein